jgi:hypothetical protein
MGRMRAANVRCGRGCAPVATGIDDVAQHRAGRREPAGAPAVEHEIADGTAFDEHRVEAVAHGGERMVQRHERRVHTHTDGHGAVRVDTSLGDGEELDAVAEAIGDGHVRGGDVGDALVVHVARDVRQPARSWR